MAQCWLCTSYADVDCEECMESFCLPCGNEHAMFLPGIHTMKKLVI